MKKYKERESYGKKLEPKGSRIIHGAGQSIEAFKNYQEALSKTKPIIYMTYCGLKGDIESYFHKLAKQIDQASYDGLIPQIGLSMTKDGSPQEHYEDQVAKGVYDQQIEKFCIGLKSLNTPVFVRIGYEFNGEWNGYQPDAFKQAWIRIVETIQRYGLDQVASVWCYSPDGKNKNFMEFYPGDEYVDWWSIDLFGPQHFSADDTIAFIKAAKDYGFPVMIGETTPRRVGVLDGMESWNNWFKPFFDFMKEYENIKAFCYINWDWSAYPMWKDWGDGRIEKNLEVLDRYKKEMDNPIFAHSGDKDII